MNDYAFDETLTIPKITRVDEPSPSEVWFVGC
jgi:hypothetical protein